MKQLIKKFKRNRVPQSWDAIEIEETGVVKTMIKFAVGSSWVDEVLKVTTVKTISYKVLYSCYKHT